MAASRFKFLVAAAACVMPLSFAAESRELYSSGSIKVAIVTDSDLSADFLNFSACAFPFEIPFQKWFKIPNRSFFRFGAEIRFWSCNFCCHCVQESLLCVKAFFVQKLYVCKRLLCAKLSVCKSYLCEKRFLCVKTSV